MVANWKNKARSQSPALLNLGLETLVSCNISRRNFPIEYKQLLQLADNQISKRVPLFSPVPPPLVIHHIHPLGLALDVFILGSLIEYYRVLIFQGSNTFQANCNHKGYFFFKTKFAFLSSHSDISGPMFGKKWYHLEIHQRWTLKPRRFGVELLPPLGVSLSQPQERNLNSDDVLEVVSRLGSKCKEMKQRKITTLYQVGVTV